MTKGHRPVSRLAVLLLALMATSCSIESTGQTKPKEGIAAVADFRALLKEVEALHPYDERQLEHFFGTGFEEVNQGASRNYRFLEAGPVSFGIGRRIDELDLRLGLAPSNQSLLNMRISGECLDVSDVEALAQGMWLSQSPSAHSLDQVYFYRKDFPWGYMAFGFRDDGDPCLVSVSLAKSPLTSEGP